MAQITTPYQIPLKQRIDMVDDDNVLACTNNLSTETMQQLLTCTNNTKNHTNQPCWVVPIRFQRILLVYTNSEKVPQAVTYGRKE